MNLITIVLIAIGLAMDCFAVSVASGIAIKQLRLRHALQIALFFGFFQAAMPVIGWLAGSTLTQLISGFDHWIAFALLAFIGGKMIYESRKLEEEKTFDPLNLYVLIVLSFATSIDALAVGLSLSFLKVAIIVPSIIIGSVTFVISLAGLYIGEKFGHFFES